ncbi:MAG: ABC transporter substrate-binding protein [Actinomycetes bacterium]
MVTRRIAGIAVMALGLGVTPALAAPVKPPARIISLSPTATEDLFAVGAGKHVVAVDNQSNYPANAPHSKLSGYTPNAEAIAAYRPDLVIVSFDANHVVAALGKLNIPVLVEPTAQTLQEAYAQIVEIGARTGHRAAAARVVSGMKTKIAAIVAATPKLREPITVYHELEPDLYSVTSNTFIGRIYTMLGLKNIADAADRSNSGYPQLSAEYVVGANPRLVILADTICCAQTAAKLKERAGWGTVAAVKTGDVVAISDDIASRWGPRVVDFMRAVAAKVQRIAQR